MNCKHAHKLIDKSVDGLTSPQEKAFLEGHLSTCPRCSEEYAAVASLDGLLAKALPLQATLGDGFAARVAEGLPARRSRLSNLKEAFVMSRIKYAFIAVVVLAVVIGSLYAPHSRDNQALAAVQSAMAKVESLHYKIELLGPRPPNWQAAERATEVATEVWSTRDASKETDESGWRIFKGGTQYYHLLLPRKNLFIILPFAPDTAKMFGKMIDPREIVHLTKEPWIHVSVTVQDIERDGKPMQQIEVEQTTDRSKVSKEMIEQGNRISQKLFEIITKPSRPGGKKGRAVMTSHRIDDSKQVYLVDPSTNLVRSMDVFTLDRKNGEWKRVARVASIDYNVDLPDDFFDVKIPPGTKVYDLRDDANSGKGTKP